MPKWCLSRVDPYNITFVDNEICDEDNILHIIKFLYINMLNRLKDLYKNSETYLVNMFKYALSGVYGSIHLNMFIYHV